ncbi:hypothetical protein TNCT_224361 [Trichonephila clavata]|uniref:Uncharacterized protein n=1 Tax=Trichonephila clavata TaxID=2740835 RepID=A0A8X6KCF8_TRICU|nr:hypothetical protein TNCT_224361 [Trichonephila clavata]
MGRANCVVSPKMGRVTYRAVRFTERTVLKIHMWPVRFRPDDCSTCEGRTLMEKRLGGLHGHLTKGPVPGLLRRGGRL